MHARWIALLGLALGCGGQTTSASSADPSWSDDGGYGGSFQAVDAIVTPDDAPSTPTVAQAVFDAWTSDDVLVPSGASAGPPFDAGPGGVCDHPLRPGDLLVDELMIESVAGASDDGEWFEVESTLDCAIDLRGLHGDCPRGTKVASFDVADDLWLPAHGTFVVADSRNPSINHELPDPLIVWTGQKGDFLPNKGGTVTLRVGDTRIDTLTYPSLPLTVGTSLAFPSDCDAAVRPDFSRWQPSSASWFPGFFGTPNAPNTDVACP